MFLFDSVLLGPLRMLMLFFGVLLVHQIITRQAITNYTLDYIVPRLAIYCASVLILIFVLIQINMYDMFSLLLILLILLILVYFQSKNPFHIIKGINAKRKSFLLNFFKFIERDISFKKLFKNNERYLYPRKINFILVSAFALGLTTFISRYIFLKNDLYTLSDLWIKNLDKIKAFNTGSWFQKGLEVNGELAFINFYAKITSTSDEMAMHSFGLIESFGLAIILYWLVKNLVKSQFKAPIIAVLFFAVFYRYLPININLLLEHNPLYFAFCFALPAMLFTVKPRIFKGTERSFFIALLLLYLAISLTSLFVYVILLPLYFVPALVLNLNKNSKFVLKSILAYFLSLAISFGVYYLASIYTSQSFKEFLITSFLQVNSYTYFPQLIVPLDQLLLIYTIVGWFTAGFLVFLVYKNRRKWMPALVFQLFFNAFMLLNKINSIWFDKDLYFQSLAVLLVISFGILVGIVVYFFKITIPKKPVLRAISLSIFFAILLIFSYLTNGFYDYNTKESEVLKADILKVYDELSNDYLPYSYAVVNQAYGQSISANMHHFITYDDFITNYVKRDSIYQIVKDNKQVIKDHPEYILPQSVFVFIAKNAKENSKYDLATSETVLSVLEQQLAQLKKKGRNIALFYQDDYMQVYQIINKEKASKIDDLIFDF
ncbi:MAG: hypothetical protein NWQ38_13155 [Cellulophaga sp.]|nr:hypothetical protein [Cellulophaga sp.]